MTFIKLVILTACVLVWYSMCMRVGSLIYVGGVHVRVQSSL